MRQKRIIHLYHLFFTIKNNRNALPTWPDGYTPSSYFENPLKSVFDPVNNGGLPNGVKIIKILRTILIIPHMSKKNGMLL